MTRYTIPALEATTVVTGKSDGCAHAVFCSASSDSMTSIFRWPSLELQCDSR